MYVTIVIIFIVAMLVSAGLAMRATAAMSGEAMRSARKQAELNARSGIIMARHRFEQDVRARLAQALLEANQPERRVDPRDTFLDDVELPVYEYDLEMPFSFNTGDDRCQTRTSIELARPPRQPMIDPNGTKVPLGSDRNGPHTDLYQFGYSTIATGTSTFEAEATIREDGTIYALVAIDATTGQAYLAGAAGGEPGGLGYLGDVDQSFAFPSVSGAPPTPDAFGNRIEVVSMEEFGTPGGDYAYFYKVRGLAGAAGGNAEVTAVWNRPPQYGGPVTLRSRVIVADHWRRASNYDPATDALRTTTASGVQTFYRPQGGYYGLIVVEGPTPSAFFEPGSRQGYVMTRLPWEWFDWRSKLDNFNNPLKAQVSITVHLAGIGDFPITSDNVASPLFANNFHPMASAPAVWDLEPNRDGQPLNPVYGEELRVGAWTSFHVTLSGEYEGVARGGVIEGPVDNHRSEQFPVGPLRWTNPATGQTLEARAILTNRGGRVRTATVYSGEGQRTDFTNAAGVITPALETWALGANPLQRIGTNTTAKMFIFSVDSAVQFFRVGDPVPQVTDDGPQLTVATTQIPSGQTASGGIVRPPTHLSVRAAAVAVIPKAVYRVPGEGAEAGNGK
jgi:hypothetical protein